MQLLKAILDDIGSVFRHLFPGALLLLAAYVRHPAWFSGVTPGPSWQQLIVLAGIGVAVGNLAYVFNRYVVIQFAEFIVFCFPTTHRFFFARKYAKVVADEIIGFYGGDWNVFRGIVRFRDAASTFLLAAGEACFLAWNPDSRFAVEPGLICVFRVLGIAFLLFAFWGHMLARLMVRQNFRGLEANPPPNQGMEPTR